MEMVDETPMRGKQGHAPEDLPLVSRNWWNGGVDVVKLSLLNNHIACQQQLFVDGGCTVHSWRTGGTGIHSSLVSDDS